jgi:CubicO group peptidase (beta-lactamase class C family)
MGPDYFAAMDETDTVDEFMEFVVGQPLRFPPGSRHEYSNAGFVVLGAIIEKVTGVSYYDFIREYVAAAAGMPDTDFYRKDADVPNLARGYLPAGGGGGLPPLPEPGGPRRIIQKPMPAPGSEAHAWVDNDNELPVIGNPSGGGYSTAKDLLNFARALTEYRLLGKEMTETVTTGKVDSHIGKYGYGFEDLIEQGRRTIGHSGGAPGVSAIFRILPDDGYVVIVLSNFDRAARLPYEEILRRLPAAT